MARSQKYSISNSSSKDYHQNTETSRAAEPKDSEYCFTSNSNMMPNLTVIDPVKPRTNYRPWIALIAVGVCAAIFLGFMYGDPNSPIHLRGPKASYTGNISVRGSLVPYPHIPDFNSLNRFPNEYFIGLDDIYREYNFNSVLNVTSGYPHHPSDQPHPDPYVHCWLETPSPRNPCFFDKGWLGRHCVSANRFGYGKITEGVHNPCFVLRLENTGSWRPRNLKANEVGGEHAKHYDPSFVGLDCKPANKRWKHVTIVQNPAKGFPLAFYPIDAFDASEYMLSAVMIKVHGIKKDENVTIECLLRTPDSYHLTDLGKIKITFFHDAKIVEATDVDPRVSQHVGKEEDTTTTSSTKVTTSEAASTTTELYQYGSYYDHSRSSSLVKIEESTPIEVTTEKEEHFPIFSN